MPLNFKAELEALVDSLEAAGAPYALCGGVAVTVHGAPRFTRDIDLLVPRSGVDSVRQAAIRCGFTLSAEPMTFEQGTSRERTVLRLTKVAEKITSRST